MWFFANISVYVCFCVYTHILVCQSLCPAHWFNQAMNGGEDNKTLQLQADERQSTMPQGNF